GGGGGRGGGPRGGAARRAAGGRGGGGGARRWPPGGNVHRCRGCSRDVRCRGTSAGPGARPRLRRNNSSGRGGHRRGCWLSPCPHRSTSLCLFPCADVLCIRFT